MNKKSLPYLVPALLALMLTVAPLTLRAEDNPEKKLSKAKAKYDADQDGKLSEDEKMAAKEGAKAKAKMTRAENLAKYDANNDGKLDADEKAKMKADKMAEKEERKAERAAKKAAREAEKK